MKIMASDPITSWQLDGETVTDFIFLGSKITADGDERCEMKRYLLLGRKAMTNLDNILKSRDIHFANKDLYSQSYGFSTSHVWIWELDHKEGWAAFELWCWGSFLRVPWTARSNQSILQEINPECSLEELMLKLQYFGHLMWRADSLEKTLMLGKIEGRRRRGWQRMRCLDSINDSMDMSLNKLREIVKDREDWHVFPADCSPWGHKVRHDLATEQQLGSSGIFMTNQEAEKMRNITPHPMLPQCPGGGVHPLLSLPYRLD